MKLTFFFFFFFLNTIYVARVFKTALCQSVSVLVSILRLLLGTQVYL